MATREQVRGLLAAGDDYRAAGAKLGISPGQAYLIATGVPADGSDSVPDQEMAERKDLLSTSQDLANPPHENPTSKDVVRSWLARRVAADEQMRTAARQRTAEPPPIASDDHDAIAVLGRQHSQIRYLLKQLQALPSHTTGGSAEHISARKTITDMVTGRLSAHERIEEEHLWPTVRAVLPDGDQLADTAVQQEQEGKDSLTELGRLNPDSREFDEQVEKFVRQVRIHVAFEEKVFLRLREAMPPAGLNALGERLLSEAEMAQEEGRPLWASGRGSTHGRSTGSSRVWTRWPGARQSRAAAARSWRRGRAQPTR